jgi:hypothetical protein
MSIKELSKIDPLILDQLIKKIGSLKDKRITKLAPDVPIFIRQDRLSDPFKEIAAKPLKRQGYKNPGISIDLHKATEKGIIGWWLDENYFPIIEK